MGILTLVIDLAKNVFAQHGAQNDTGVVSLRKPAVPRGEVLDAVAALPPSLIGIEACAGAHHWAREFQRLGHLLRLMAPKSFAPYRQSGKRGKNDAAAICEAVQRPATRLVPVKPSLLPGIET